MTQTTSAQGRAPRIRLGMVGGGQGAFIGAVHRIAARIDDGVGQERMAAVVHKL